MLLAGERVQAGDWPFQRFTRTDILSCPSSLQECYTTLVWNLDLTSEYCLKLGLSKGLGLAMVAGGAILKLPQIITVVRSGSARGLSLSSYVLDTVATGITVAYNVRNGFPYSTWGEMAFLLAQNVRSSTHLRSLEPSLTS